MNWVHALHVIGVVLWFGSLLQVTRMLKTHATAPEGACETLTGIERRTQLLIGIPGLILTVGMGLVLLFYGPRGAKFYKALGLNDRQISIIANATKKRHYYWLSPLGRRLIELELGPVALAFLGRTDPESLERIYKLYRSLGDQWPAAWLHECQLAEAAHELGYFAQPTEVSS